jgi:hypothetical protein
MKRKLLFQAFWISAGIPLVIGIILITIAIFLEDVSKGMAKFIGYGASFAFLYFIFGMFRFIKLLADLPPREKGNKDLESK